MSHLFVSLKDHVYNYISEQIGNGALRPDEKINEQQISDHLKISRTPVREALIHLAAEGYIENIPRKGFIVRPLEQPRAQELYKIIGTLEAMAVQDAADHLGEAAVALMQELLNQMELAISTEAVAAYHQYQNRFHDVYIDAAGNTELATLLHQLKKNFIRQGYAVSGAEDILSVLKATNAEHVRMVEFLEAKQFRALADYIRDVHWRAEQTTYDLL